MNTKRLDCAERALGLGRPDDGLCNCPGEANRYAVKESPWMVVRCPSGVGVCYIARDDWAYELDEGRGGIRPGATVYDTEPPNPPAVCLVCGRPKHTVFTQFQSHDVWSERGAR